MLDSEQLSNNTRSQESLENNCFGFEINFQSLSYLISMALCRISGLRYDPLLPALRKPQQQVPVSYKAVPLSTPFCAARQRWKLRRLTDLIWQFNWLQALVYPRPSGTTSSTRWSRCASWKWLWNGDDRHDKGNCELQRDLFYSSELGLFFGFIFLLFLLTWAFWDHLIECK